MNHLENLVAEFLEYSGYFVRKSVLVGRRPSGGYDGELDVVAWHPVSNHRIHIECSLDAEAWAKRELRYKRKFAIGRKHIGEVFPGTLDLDQVVILTFAGNRLEPCRKLGGGRLITTKEFIASCVEALKGTSPQSSAVPQQYPMLRTIQLCDWARETSPVKLIP